MRLTDSYHLNQTVPAIQLLVYLYKIVSCINIDSTHSELLLALTRAAAVVSPSMEFTNEVRGAVRSRKVLTAYKDRNVLRLTETGDDIAKLATVRFLNHVFFVCH